MLDRIALIDVAFGAIVISIVAFIVRAVRLTKASIEATSAHVDLTNPDVARAFVGELRGRDVPCPRCGGQTSTRLGRANGYGCDTCAFEFEGPVHMPGQIPTQD